MQIRCSFEFQEHKTLVANKEISVLSCVMGELVSHFCWCWGGMVENDLYNSEAWILWVLALLA